MYCREETIDISAKNCDELIEKVKLEINTREKEGWSLIKTQRYASQNNLFPYHYVYTVQKYES